MLCVKSHVLHTPTHEVSCVLWLCDLIYSLLQESNPTHFTDSISQLPAVMTHDHMSYFLGRLNLAMDEQGTKGGGGRGVCVCVLH